MLQTLALCAPLLLITSFHAAAQTEDTKFYKLDFTVKEVEDGHTINSRTYSSNLGIGEHPKFPSIRTGSRVPVPSGPQYTYVDAGVNFDCTDAALVGDELRLDLMAEITSFVPAPNEAENRMPPVIRENRWTSRVIVPLRKPTIVFSSDDLTSKRKMQVEITATPILP